MTGCAPAVVAGFAHGSKDQKWKWKWKWEIEKKQDEKTFIPHHRLSSPMEEVKEPSRSEIPRFASGFELAS